MKLVTEGLKQNGTVEESTSRYEKKKTNDCPGDTREESRMLKKGEITTVGSIQEGNEDGYGSEDESNTNVKMVSTPRHGGDVEDTVDTLTTQVLKMKMSSISQEDDSLQKVTDHLSNLSVHEIEDGRKSPQLLPRGPDGGKPAAYNHMMYGQQDWSAIQANVRVKGQTGKRGYEDEINPYKYVRNAEPVENGDYTDMPFMNPMSDAMTQPLMTQPQMAFGMSQQALHRSFAQGQRKSLNNLNQPQTSSYQDVISNSVRNVMCGGSVTVSPPESQHTLFTQDLANQGPDWDPDSLLALLQDSPEDTLANPAFEQGLFSRNNQFQRDEQIMTHQVNGLQKAKRNLSGEDSGYDSEVSRMSSSNSPFSQESVFSPEPVPSPQTGNQPTQTGYMSHMAYSSNSNMGSPATSMGARPLASGIGSPHSIDSGITSDHGSPGGSYMSAMSPAGSHMSVMSPAGSHMSAMSPAGSHMSAMSPAGSYMSAMSPAGSHMTATSPAHVFSADSPTPSPGTTLNLPAVDGQTPDSIMSELTKPIPHSPIDQQVPPGQYIDEHLGELKDLYDVIATDLKNQQHKRNSGKEPAERATSGMPPQGKLGSTPKAPETDSKKAAPEVSKDPQKGLPVTSTTMTPVILKPLTTGAQMTPVLTQPSQVIQVGQGSKVPVMGQPIMSGQNIVWVPVNTAPPIIVVRQTPPANQKKGGPSKPRPILPKMPTISPGSSNTSTSVTPSTARMVNSSPQTKPQAIASNSPAVVNALTSHPGSQQPGKMGNTSATNKTANRSMTAHPLQQQRQMHQAMPTAQGMIRQPGMGVPQPLNPAMDSCAPNKLNLARRYIAEMKKEDLHFQDQDGDTYLHVAICRTDPYLVKAILERLVRENLIKELIDRPNKKRQTPLYVAVADNQPLMVRELVQCGAEPDCLAECQWNNGMRKEVKAAIHCAAQGGQAFTTTLAELLKAKGINLNLANSEGLTAVHCAIQEHGKVRGGQVINSIPTVEMLIRAGADPNVQDKKSGKTPLMYAIETKDYNLVLTMVKLIDKDKLRLMLKTQTFDGSNCSKICSGLRMEPDVEGWRKINTLILSVSNGSDTRLCDSMPMIPS